MIIRFSSPAHVSQVPFWSIISMVSHYRKTQICQVSRPLPSARTRALGKDVVCRVPSHEHSANICHTACSSFAECRPSAKNDTRQTVPFAECWPSGTRQSRRTCPARTPAVRRPLGGWWRQVFAECHHLALGKGDILPSASSLALGKFSFAECWSLGTRQNWVKKMFLAFKIFWSLVKFDNLIPRNIKNFYWLVYYFLLIFCLRGIIVRSSY